MKSAHLRFAVPAALLLGLSVAPALAQRQPTPEQRIDRLERQVQQVQRQVFPRGRPADTAGLIDEPAATRSAVLTLDQRLAAVERQLSELLRLAEENGHRVGTIERELGRIRDDQDRRLRSLETSVTAAQPAVVEAVPPAVVSRPKVETASSAGAGNSPSRPAPQPAASFVEDGEAAYDEGYQLWVAGRYDAAITSLRAMASSFTGHRRVSWANNLAGRALLDKGQPRAAAEALLANYRSNPRGERAADSLFYLGQALMKLGQPSQACKVYAELEDVYPNMRAALKELLPKAKAEAKCG